MYWIQLVRERLDELSKIREKLNAKGRFQEVREIDSLIRTNIYMLRGVNGKSREEDNLPEMLFNEVS